MSSDIEKQLLDKIYNILSDDKIKLAHNPDRLATDWKVFKNKKLIAIIKVEAMNLAISIDNDGYILTPQAFDMAIHMIDKALYRQHCTYTIKDIQKEREDSYKTKTSYWQAYYKDNKIHIKYNNKQECLYNIIKKAVNVFSIKLSNDGCSDKCYLDDNNIPYIIRKE